MEQIYFDHAATTPPRSEVVEAMLPYLRKQWGNPSSLYAAGARAAEGVERARQHVAALLGAETDEIVFTSGGTEADNHALVGVGLALEQKGNHIVTSSVEHHAVLDTARLLESRGQTATYLSADAEGTVDPESVRAAITDQTVLVSIMHANNEVGTLQPVDEIGAVCRECGVLLHTDAVQTVGHVPIDVHAMNIDLLSLSGHKLYGPKGVGALYIRKGTRVAPFLQGGAQELGRRASTENVPGIVGLGEAARLARHDMDWEMSHTAGLRDRLIRGVLERVPDTMLTGHPTRRLPNNASFCIGGAEGESMLLNLDLEGIAVSSGSACTSGALEPSHVLLAMGIPPGLAQGSLRVTVGRGNTEAEADRFLEILPAVVEKLRKMSPLSNANSGRGGSS
jgi:cysteine desulfurase